MVTTDEILERVPGLLADLANLPVEEVNRGRPADLSVSADRLAEPAPNLVPGPIRSEALEEPG